MAHELATTSAGDKAVFVVGQTAWHREGHELTEAPDLDRAIQLIEADYTVEKRPTQFECKTPDGDTYLKKSDAAFVTVRTDTQVELGAVGSSYTPLQNADAFRVLEPLLDTGVATLETGGVLRDGADAWMMVRWDLAQFGPITQRTFGDELKPFGLLANNHSGRRGVLLQDTNVRVVCANTLGWAEGATERRVVVKHSSEVQARVIEAATGLWHNVVSRYEKLAEQYELLRSTMLTEAEFKSAVLDAVAPDPREAKKFNPEARLAELVVQRAVKKRSELHRLWMEGKGHTGEPSAWFAYNAVVEAVDHNAELWPTRAGAWRTASLLDGTLREIKETALNNLLALSA